MQTWKKWLKTKYQTTLRFILFVYQHFIEDDCTYKASALAFTSLLAVVPLMSVGLAVLSTFPVFHDLSGPLQDFIFENFVPATGKVIQNYLQQFTAQVSKLSFSGIFFLLVTALLVMYTVEQSMNKIWRISTPRKGVSAFLLYWSILSLAPVLLGLSLAASSYLFSMPLFRNYPDHSIILRYVPFTLSLIAYTSLYVIVPNCKVKISHAFRGALIAALSFEGAKYGFAYYLTQYNTYELLYGAFATVPIFFIWVYWVWFITLLGAEITYAYSVHHERRVGQPLDGFTHALLWLEQLWHQHKEGKSMSISKLVAVDHAPYSVDIWEMVTLLCQTGLVHETIEGEYMLSRDIQDLTLYDLTKLLPYKLPAFQKMQTSKQPVLRKWGEVLRSYDEDLQNDLKMNLTELFTA